MNKSLNIQVKNSGLFKLQFHRDLPDGNLFIAESQRHIPFKIKRVYFINSLANPKAVRGYHAHRTLDQILFCISGSFTLALDDGSRKQRIRMNDPSCGIRLGPLLWHTMSSFSYDCIILVFASAFYDNSDYIRDYSEFLSLTRTHR
jgi:dTDP-4-dehydrorhamnose 3,5-epimerase-like enzyme